MQLSKVSRRSIVIPFTVLMAVGTLSWAADASNERENEYKIDLEFENGARPLVLGTPSEVDNYNEDTSDPSHYPVFAEKAVLHFPSRNVEVYLIASKHDGAADESFIVEQIKKFRKTHSPAQVFIEQGEPRSPEGAVTLLKSGAANHGGDLEAIVDHSQSQKDSFLNPLFDNKLVFGQVEHEAVATGLRFENFDLQVNLTPQALTFLTGQLAFADAVDFVRADFGFTTFTMEEFKSIFTALFPKFFPAAEIAQITDCCGEPKTWVRNFLRTNQLRNLVRERYMRHVLSLRIQNGDFIITHPVHMRHILTVEHWPAERE